MHLSCQAPLTVRRVHSAGSECALCLVGTAAGPLSGDDLELCLEVDQGAQATLVATGATIAQGRAGAAAALLRTVVDVGPDATFDADPGALIVCDGARVDAAVSVSLAASATLSWREVLVLGRAGAPARPGRFREWRFAWRWQPVRRTTCSWDAKNS